MTPDQKLSKCAKCFSTPILYTTHDWLILFSCFILCNYFYTLSILLFVLWCISFNSEYIFFTSFTFFLIVLIFSWTLLFSYIWYFPFICYLLFPYLPCYSLLSLLSIYTAYVWDFVWISSSTSSCVIFSHL